MAELLRRLIIRPGAIGDVIVSLPAMEHLKSRYTEVWSTEAVRPLIRAADRTESIAATGLDLLELGLASPALLRRLEGFDDIVSWYGSNRDEFRDAMRPFPVRFLDALPAGNKLHAVDFYLSQVGAPLGVAPHLDVPRIQGSFVAIHPFSGSPRKNWPLTRFRELADKLDRPVEWCAGPEEELAEARRFESLGDLAAWLGSASLYVGNDSGISHLAAAVGVPVVALFGPTDPAVWAPRGACVRVVRSPARLDALDVSCVLEACRELLDRA